MSPTTATVTSTTYKKPLYTVYESESESDSEYESECERIQKTLDYYKYTQHIHWIKKKINEISTTRDATHKKQLIIEFYTYLINNIDVVKRNNTFMANVVRNALELRELYKNNQHHSDLVALCEFFLQVIRNY